MVLRWFVFVLGGFAQAAPAPKNGEDEDGLNGEDDEHG